MRTFLCIDVLEAQRGDLHVSSDINPYTDCLTVCVYIEDVIVQLSALPTIPIHAESL